MRYCILGDIHANWEALAAVLEDARGKEIDQFVCVGDVVGYNANPVECLQVLQKLDAVIVKGNHDAYCSTEDALIGFHPLAAEVVKWTRKRLNDEQRDFLAELPMSKRLENFTIVHSTLDMPEKWGYVFDTLEAESNFTYQRSAVCFFGHTHVPLAFEKGTDIKYGLYKKIKITLGKKYFINVGSVGQPRDGNPDAAYVIYDSNRKVVELFRIPYDIRSTQARILDAGLPERLAMRLKEGR